MARTYNYFAYGSNMNLPYLKSWLTQRGGRPDGIRGASPASLAGYRLAFNFPATGGHTANLVEAKDGVVHGVLMEIDEQTLQRLEQKDNVPRAYQRAKVTVSDTEGKTRDDVIALIAPADRCKEGAPSKKYLEQLVKGAEDFKLPADYVATLRATETAGS